MALLTFQRIVETGLEATYSAAAALGDSFANNGSTTFVHVVNGAGAPITVTCDADVSTLAVAGYGNLTRANLSVVVTNGESRFIGPFPVQAFGAAPLIEYSDETSVTVAAIEI
jgi:hypothetical protein